MGGQTSDLVELVIRRVTLLTIEFRALGFRGSGFRGLGFKDCALGRMWQGLRKAFLVESLTSRWDMAITSKLL